MSKRISNIHTRLYARWNGNPPTDPDAAKAKEILARHNMSEVHSIAANNIVIAQGVAAALAAQRLPLVDRLLRDALKNAQDAQYREIMGKGAYVCTDAEFGPENGLNVDDITEAMRKAINSMPRLWYKVSNYLPVVDPDGDPLIIEARVIATDEPVALIHPDNLEALREMARKHLYRLEELPAENWISFA